MHPLSIAARGVRQRVRRPAQARIHKISQCHAQCARGSTCRAKATCATAGRRGWGDEGTVGDEAKPKAGRWNRWRVIGVEGARPLTLCLRFISCCGGWLLVRVAVPYGTKNTNAPLFLRDRTTRRGARRSPAAGVPSRYQRSPPTSPVTRWRVRVPDGKVSPRVPRALFDRLIPSNVLGLAERCCWRLLDGYGAI